MIEKLSTITSLLIGGYLLCFSSNYYDKLFVFPIIYFIVSNILFKIIRIKKLEIGILLKFTMFLMYFKYVILPFLVISIGSYFSFGKIPLKESLDEAIYLQCIELIFIYFGIYLSFYKKIKNIIEKRKENIQFLIMGLVLLILSSTKISSFVILKNIGYLLIYFYFIFSIKNKVKNGKIWSYLISIVYLYFIKDNSRWTILFSTISILYILKILYKNITRKEYFYICLFSLMIILSITLNKFSWIKIVYKTDSIFQILKITISAVQEYFSGPKLLAQVIEMNKEMITIKTFINDFLGSIPIISKIINQQDRTNVYYNLYLGLNNTSQIIPISGIGYIYFPYIFYVLSFINYYFVGYFDKKYRIIKTIDKKYIYINFGLFLCMGIGFNTQIIIGAYFYVFLIPLTILKVAKYLKIKIK